MQDQRITRECAHCKAPFLIKRSRAANGRGTFCSLPCKRAAGYLDKSCAVDGCERPAWNRGWCRMHYARWYRSGSTEDSTRRGRYCTVDNCERKHLAKGLCAAHYKRQRMGTDLSTLTRANNAANPEPRFFSKIDSIGGAWTHWLWVAAINVQGYGYFSCGTRVVLAHRWAYERFVGPIPGGYVIDHLCRVRHCVNPLHLEAVTSGENIRRDIGALADIARRTQCVQGHVFTAASSIDRGGVVDCLICCHEESVPENQNSVAVGASM